MAMLNNQMVYFSIESHGDFGIPHNLGNLNGWRFEVVVDETARPKHQQLTIGWSTIFHVGINHVVAYVYEYVYTYVYGMYAFLWYTYNILQQKNDCIRTSARYVKCKRILSIYWNILRESWCKIAGNECCDQFSTTVSRVSPYITVFFLLNDHTTKLTWTNHEPPLQLCT